jgi:hypothetical protein
MPQSSLLLKNKTVAVIPIGSLVVSDNGEARIYDSQTDTLADALGVVCALEYTSGREWSPFYTGTECYENDSILWNEDLTIKIVNGETVENVNHTAWNPYSDIDKYSILVCHGFAAVIHGTTLPSTWRLIKAGTNYDWVFIR